MHIYTTTNNKNNARVKWTKYVYSKNSLLWCYVLRQTSGAALNAKTAARLASHLSQVEAKGKTCAHTHTDIDYITPYARTHTKHNTTMPAAYIHISYDLYGV